jgi:hypothetical protein
MTEIPDHFTPTSKVEPPFMKEWQARMERQVRLSNWTIASQISNFLRGRSPGTEGFEEGNWGQRWNRERHLLA